MSAVLSISPAARSVRVQRETFDEMYPDIAPLLQEHWKEIALHQDEIPLAPDFERYKKLCNDGMCILMAARRDVVLIGYAVFFLHHHIHYKHTLYASNDVLFVRKPERQSIAGIRLIRDSERELDRLGVRRVTWHIKGSNDFSPILKRMGYEHEEVVMGKMLGGRHGG